MLRIIPIEDAKQAKSYYSKSDGGYYLDANDLRPQVTPDRGSVPCAPAAPQIVDFRRREDQKSPDYVARRASVSARARLTGPAA